MNNTTAREPKISIIVPVYNVEQYLPQCIESIINQTYQNLQIILVDDGSPDNSGRICDEYAEKDLRIKVIHKENGGVGSARNEGINYALGEYIYFVDADDYLESELIDICMNTIIKQYPDMLIFGFNKVDKNGLNKKPVIPPAYSINDLSTEKDALADIFCSGTGLAVWDKLIKTKLIKDNNILFDNKKRGEDFTFVVECLHHTNNLVSISKAMYNYRILIGISNKYDHYLIENHLENYEKLNQFFKSSSKVNTGIERFLGKLFVLWFILVIPLNISNTLTLSKKRKKELLSRLISNVQIKKWSKEINPDLLSSAQKIILKIFQFGNPSLLLLQSKFFSLLRKNGIRN